MDEILVDLSDPDEEAELTEVVTLDEDDAEAEAPFVWDEEAPNLAFAFAAHPKGVEAMKKLASQMLDDFQRDWDSNEELRAQRAKEWRFFAGLLEKKSFPFENCANGNIPIMMENVSRLYTRCYGELFGDWQNVCGAVPLGPGDDGIAMAVTTHTNWQLREQIPNFRREQHRGVLAFFAHGDVTFRSFYNETTELNEHEYLTSDDFVIPYARVTTKPDYADLPHYCLRLRWYRHELEAKRGAWFDVDRVLQRADAGWDTADGEPMADASAEATGLVKPDTDDGAPYELVQYEGWLMLPGQTRARWCQAVLDRDTEAVLLLTIHEQPNWQDKLRYERESAELDDYRAAQNARMMMMQAAQATEQANALAVEEKALADAEAEEDGTAQVALGVEPGMVAATLDMQRALPPEQVPVPEVPPPPPPPAWMQDPEDPEERPSPVKMEPIRLFTHIVCLENLAGNLGLSPGREQVQLNEAANVALNQFIDAATLGNVGGYVAAPNVKFDTPFAVKPGKVVSMRQMPTTDIRHALMPLQFKDGNPQLVQLVQLFQQWAQSSMQAPNVLSGDPGKSGETYRGIAARIEQATKQLSVLTQKYAWGVEQLIKNNSLLNAKFLKEEEFFRVTDHLTQVGMEQQVRREWYERGYSIVLRADLRFATLSQRIAEADEAYQRVVTDPLLGMNMALRYAVTKKMFEARGRHDLVALLGQPPPPPPMFGPPAPPPGAPPGQSQQGGAPGGQQGGQQ